MRTFLILLLVCLAKGRAEKGNLCKSLSTCVHCKLSSPYTGLKSYYSEACLSCNPTVFRKIRIGKLAEDLYYDIGIDPRTLDIEDKVQCSSIDDAGCLRVFWYTSHKEKNVTEDDPGTLLVWSDKLHNVCPPQQNDEDSGECSRKKTCGDCMATKGCGWCGDPYNTELSDKCNSIWKTDYYCSRHFQELPGSDGPDVVREFSQSSKWNSIRLRPEHVKMQMRVGDTKYLKFTYNFGPDNGLEFTNNLPKEVEVNIFSTCGSQEFYLQEVNNCSRHGIEDVEFFARFHLGSCPTNPYLWKEQTYKLGISPNYSLSIDLGLSCSCPCDKRSRCNEEKSLTKQNSCSKESSCTDCLKRLECNWCSDPGFSFVDGSPLPRCNNDNFFTSRLCEPSKRINPAVAFTDQDDCNNCGVHSCSGGVCNERTRIDRGPFGPREVHYDVWEGNQCVSYLTCGDCIRSEGCSWCSENNEGPKCDKLENWIEESREGETKQNKCPGNLYEGIPEAKPRVSNFIKNTHNFDPLNNLAWNGDYTLTIDANASFAFENKENVLKIALKPKQILEFFVLLNIENLDLDELNQRSPQLRLASEDRKSLTNLKLDFASGNTIHSIHFSVKLMLIDCQEKEMFTEHPLYLVVHEEDKLGSPLGVLKIAVKTFCQCDCEKPSNIGYHANHPKCGGGVEKCGVCDGCPDGSYGQFCQCSADHESRDNPDIE